MKVAVLPAASDAFEAPLHPSTRPFPAMRLALLAVACLCMAGCASSPSPAPGPGTAADSGLDGLATAGPTCPVEHVPPDPACGPKPVAVNLTATQGDPPQVVKAFASGSDGTFRVALAPGTYVVRPADGGPAYPRCSPTEPVAVVAAAYAHVNVTCDTGIR
jgi:hypothetical protein